MAFRWGRRRDHELTEELRGHLEEAVRERMERGQSREQAEGAARREFGNAVLVAEVTRDQWGWVWLETLLQDLRYGLRQLRRNAGFTLAVTLTLALGIGANTAVFSVVHGVLLQPLPHPAADRLVRVWDRHEKSGTLFFSVQPANYFDWRANSTAFADLGAYREDSFGFSVAGSEPQAVGGVRVTASLLAVLRAEPMLGRSFLPDEDRPGAPPVAILTYGFWQRHFGGERDVLNRRVALNGEPYTVVGVLPPGFRFPQQDRAEVLIPYQLANDPGQRGAHFLRVLGRLRPAVTKEQGLAELNTFARRAEQEFPQSNAGWTVALLPLHQAVVGDVEAPLFVLLGAVGFVLLIACCNVANLLLVRFTARHKEMAIRAALGASRRRIVRQMLCESLLLASIGGGAGVLFGQWGLQALLAIRPGSLPRSSEISLDSTVLAFSGALTLVTALVFGLLPTARPFRSQLTGALQEGGRAGSGSPRQRVRGVLVVSEMALAVVLLVGASLLLQSFLRLQAVDPGFDATQTIALRITPLASHYSQPEHRVAFFRDLLQRVADQPGIESAGIVHRLPLEGNSGISFFVEGRPAPAPGEAPGVNYRSVSPGYFQTLGIPLRRGRLFNEQETWRRPDAVGVGAVIINQALAGRYWPEEDPIGKRVGSGPDGPWMEIVGVVANAKETSLSEPAEPALYLPYGSSPVPGMTLVARSVLARESLVAAVRSGVLAINPHQPIGQVQGLEQFLSSVVAEPRFNATLLSLFAALAVGLAVIGAYGVMAFSVAQRTREIGIRIALGAARSGVMRLVLRQALRLALAGIAFGIAGALAAGRALRTLLFEVSATDPATLFSCTVLMTAVALLAASIPARRALRVDPSEVLRHE